MIVLLYHQISTIAAEYDPLRLAVSPQHFSEQMEYLKKNDYSCISLESLVKAKITGEKLSERAFAITFDDGYSDNYEQAFPILQDYNFTATIFLVTSRVGNSVNWEGVENQKFHLMTWEQALEMSNNGFHFGSHTHTHLDLTRYGQEDLNFELVHSKEILEQKLSVPVRMFAYPYERVTTSLMEQVAQANYLAAFGSLRFPESCYNFWRRECFGSDTMRAFRYKLSDNWRRAALFKYHSSVGKSLGFLKRQFKQKISIFS